MKIIDKYYLQLKTLDPPLFNIKNLVERSTLQRSVY